MTTRWLGLGAVELVQLALVVASFWAGSLLPSPAAIDASARAWPTGLALVLLGSFIVVAQRRWPELFGSTRRQAASMSAVLVLTLASLVSYVFLLESWTCSYYGRARIVGSELTAYAAQYLREQPATSCEELLKLFTGRADEIWTHASSLRRELLLSALHLCSLAGCAIFALLAVGLVARHRRRDEGDGDANGHLGGNERIARLAIALSRLVLAHETILRHAQTALRAPELIEIPSPAHARSLWVAVLRRAEIEGVVPQLVELVLDENPAADELRELAASWPPRALDSAREARG